MTAPELTKRERYLRTVKGEETDHPPVWIMRQAGRYMPQYMALRQQFSFRDFCLNPEASVAATLLPLELLDVDLLIIFNDILIPLEQMGLEVDFPTGGPKIMNPVRTEADLDHFQVAKFERPAVAESLSLLKTKTGPDVPVIGFCGAPFTLAVYAAEGKMTKTQEHIKALQFSRPELLDQMLERITETAANYLIAQVIEGGADGVQIFESWGGILAMPQDYERFAAKWQCRLIEKVRTVCPDIPIHLYLKGSNGRVGEMAKSGADVLSIDWTTPLAEARDCTSLALQGNLDPMTMMDSECVESAVERMLDGFDYQRGWIANLGHGITPRGTIAAAKRFVEVIHQMKSK